VSEREHSDPRPRDDTDAVQDIARDLAEVAAQISTFNTQVTPMGQISNTIVDTMPNGMNVRGEQEVRVSKKEAGVAYALPVARDPRGASCAGRGPSWFLPHAAVVVRKPRSK